MDKTFLEYLQEAKHREPSDTNEGGYLIPPSITVKRPGIVGLFFRMIHDKRGWIIKEYNWGTIVDGKAWKRIIEYNREHDNG